MSMFDEEEKETLITSSVTSTIKLTQYILTEIELITTVIHQYLERSLNSTSSLHTSSASLSASKRKRQEINNFFKKLLKQFTYTRRSLSSFKLSARIYIDPFECIYPFCLVIKQNESPSSITAVSINCVTNILNDPLFLSKSAPHIKECIQCIGDTICCVILDVEQKAFDQGLLLKFMNLISCLLNHSCFIYLSENMIWNIFEKLLYIYFNVNADHHSQALFEFAEITVNLLIQRVFQQLPQFINMEDSNTSIHLDINNVQQSATKMDANSVKRYLSLKDKIFKEKNKALSVESLESLQSKSLKSFARTQAFNIDCLVRLLSALCCGDPCGFDGGELNVDDKMDENRLILCLGLILIALRESGEYFVRIPRILSLMTNNLCYILVHFGSNTQYIMLYEVCLRTYIELLYKLREKMKVQNEILFRMLFIRTLKDSLPKALKREKSGVSVVSNDCLFDTDRVDEILSKHTHEMDTNEAFKLKKEDSYVYDISAMSLMTNVSSNTTNYTTTKTKSQSIDIEDDKAKKETNMIFVVCALQHLVDLCDKAWFIRELYLNYDCSLYSHNLCADLISLLSKHIMAGNDLISLQCLVNISNSLILQLHLDSKQQIDMNQLRVIQEQKNILRRGIDIFNKNPEKGILYLYDNGIFGRLISPKVFTKSRKKKNNAADDMLGYNTNNISRMIDSTSIVDQIVDIFFYFADCNDLQIGCYLGSEHILNEKVRHRYIARRYSFAGLSLDGAMRLFFEDFRLPVETQEVDRILESFAAKYCLDNDANNGEWKMSASTTYTLCFALMMLHTNQHNESLQLQNNYKRMKLEEFVNLVRCVKDAENIEIHLLESLFNSMTRNEIKLCHDATSNNLSKLNWSLLITCKQTNDYINNAHAYDCNHDVLNIIFAPITSTFGFILDTYVMSKQDMQLIMVEYDADALIGMICSGFYHLALFVSSTINEEHENKMDLLILRLSQISGLYQLNNHSQALSYSKSYAKKEISHLLFNILYEFGANCLSVNGWNHILQIIMRCARCSLLPLIMYQLDDFVGGSLAGRPLNRSFKYLFRIDEHLIDEECDDIKQGIISQFIDYFNTANGETKEDKKEEEEKLIRSAQIILSDFCQIHLMMKKSAQFNIESVRNLMHALITNSDFGILQKEKLFSIEIVKYKFDEYCIYIDDDDLQPILQRSCLSVQFLTSILLHNWRRIDFIWDTFMIHLKHLLDINNIVYNNIVASNKLSLCELHETMVESAVISILKICVRALQLPCNNSTKCMMSAFKLLSSLSTTNFHRYRNVSYQITAAIHRFIKQLYDKKQLYLKHKDTEIASLSVSSISSMRERHAKRLSHYQWWNITPFADIFKLIKTASSKPAAAAALCHISAKIFVHILGVIDDDNNNNSRNKLLFLPHNPQLMDDVIQLLETFIKHKQFRSDDAMKVMIIKAIGNVLNELQYFYEIIKEEKEKQEPGNLNKKQVIFQYIGVLLNYIIILCGSVSCVIRSKALLLLEHILFTSQICNTFINTNIEFMVNEIILNTLCTHLIKRQLLSLNAAEFITKSRVFAVSLLNKYFLLHLDELFQSKTYSFKQIWMEILCCSDVMLEMKSDPNYNQLYIEIKESLQNVLKVMMEKKILDNDKISWHKINDMFPRMKSELLYNHKNDRNDVLHPTPTPYVHVSIDSSV